MSIWLDYEVPRYLYRTFWVCLRGCFGVRWTLKLVDWVQRIALNDMSSLDLTGFQAWREQKGWPLSNKMTKYNLAQFTTTRLLAKWRTKGPRIQKERKLAAVAGPLMRTVHGEWPTFSFAQPATASFSYFLCPRCHHSVLNTEVGSHPRTHRTLYRRSPNS